MLIQKCITELSNLNLRNMLLLLHAVYQVFLDVLLNGITTTRAAANTTVLIVRTVTQLGIAMNGSFNS